MSNKRSNYYCDPVRAASIAVLHVTALDCKRLGKSRQQREWSKFSNRWGALRRIVRWLHSDQYEMMLEVVGLNSDVVRVRLLRLLAGT